MIKKFLLLFLFFTANFYGFSLNEMTAKIDVDRANRLFKYGNQSIDGEYGGRT